MPTAGTGGPTAQVSFVLDPASVNRLVNDISNAFAQAMQGAGVVFAQQMAAMGKQATKGFTVANAAAQTLNATAKNVGATYATLHSNQNTYLTDIQRNTLKSIALQKSLGTATSTVNASLRRSTELERQQFIRSTSDSQTEGRLQVEQLKNVGRVQNVEAQKSLVSARETARRRLAIVQELMRTIGRLEKGLGATIAGIARTTTSAVGKIFGGLGSIFKRDHSEIVQGFAKNNKAIEQGLRKGNTEFNSGLSESLNKRERAMRSSFTQQEQIVRRSVLRQEAQLTKLRTQTSKGVLGAVTGRGVGGGLGLGSLFGGLGLIGALKSTFTIGADFSQGLTVLQSQLGLTGEQMKGVRALSIQLGNDITLPGVSALDAAQAIQTLTKTFGYLGPAAVDAAEKAAKGTLQLARATGSSAEDSAAIIGAAVNVFKIGADQAVSVADSVAVAISKAAGVSFSDFKESFQEGATVFEQFVGNAEPAKEVVSEFSTALAILARNGIVGSEAGNGLKQFFLQGSASGKRALEVTAEITKRAGVTGKIFTDAAGGSRKFGDSLDILRRGLVGLTDEQRNNTLAVLFGSKSRVAANALLGTSKEEFDKLNGSMNRQGAAAAIAAAQNSGLRGALDALGSVIQTLQIQFFELVNGPLRTATLFIATFINNIFSGSGVWEVIRRGLLGVAAGLAAVIAVKGAVETVKLLGTALTALTTPFGAILVVAALVGGAIALMTDNTSKLGQALRDLTAPLAEGFGKLIGAKGQTEEVIGLKGVEGARTKAITVADIFTRLKFILTKDVIPAIRNVAVWVGTHLVSAFKVAYHFMADLIIPAIIHFGAIVIRDLVGAFQATVRFVEDKLIPGFKTVYHYVAEVLIPKIVHVAGVIGDAFVVAAHAVVDFWRMVKPYLDPLIDGFSALGKGVGAIFTGDFSNLGAGFVAAGSGIASTVAKTARSIGDALHPIVNRIGQFFTDLFSPANIKKYIKGALEFINTLGVVLGHIVSDPKVLKVVGIIAGVLVGAAGLIAFQFITGVFQGIIDNLPQLFTKLSGLLELGFKAAFQHLGLILAAVLGTVFLASTLSRLFHKSGQAAGDGFVAGLKSKAGGAKGFLTGLLGPGQGGGIGKSGASGRAQLANFNEITGLNNQLRILGGRATPLTLSGPGPTIDPVTKKVLATSLENQKAAIAAHREQIKLLSRDLPASQLAGLKARDTLNQVRSGIGAIGGGIRGVGTAAGILTRSLRQIPALYRAATFGAATFAVGASGVASVVRPVKLTPRFAPLPPPISPSLLSRATQAVGGVASRVAQTARGAFSGLGAFFDPASIAKKFQTLGPSVTTALALTRSEARKAFIGLAAFVDSTGITKKFQQVATGVSSALGTVRATARKALFGLAIFADTSGITKKFQDVNSGARQALGTVRATARGALFGLAAFVDSTGITKKFQAAATGASKALGTVRGKARSALFGLAAFVDSTGITQKFQAVATGAGKALGAVRTSARNALFGLAAFVDSTGITKKIRGIPTAAKGAFDKLKALPAGVGTAFGTAFTGIGKAWTATTTGITRTASTAFTKVGTAVGTLATSIGQSAFGKLGKAIGQGISNGVSGAASSLRLTTTKMFDGLRQAAVNAGTTVGKAFGTTFATVATTAAAGLGGFAAGKAEGSAGGSGLFSAALAGIGTGALIGTSVAGPAGTAAGVAIGTVTAAATLLGAAFGRAQKAAKDFREEVDRIADSIRTNLVDAIKDGTLTLGDLKKGLSIHDLLGVGDVKDVIGKSFVGALSDEQLHLLRQAGIEVGDVIKILDDSNGNIDKFNTKFSDLFTTNLGKSDEFVKRFGPNAKKIAGIIRDIAAPGGFATIGDFLVGKNLTDPINAAILANDSFLQSALDTNGALFTENGGIIKAAQAAEDYAVVMGLATDANKKFVRDAGSPREHVGLETIGNGFDFKNLANQFITGTTAQLKPAVAAWQALIVSGLSVDEANAELAKLKLPPIPPEAITAWEKGLGAIDKKAQALNDQLDAMPGLFAKAFDAANPKTSAPAVAQADAIIAASDAGGAVGNAATVTGLRGTAEQVTSQAHLDEVFGNAISAGIRNKTIVDEATARAYMEPIKNAAIDASNAALTPADPADDTTANKTARYNAAVAINAQYEAAFAATGGVVALVTTQLDTQTALSDLETVRQLMAANPLITEIRARFVIDKANKADAHNASAKEIKSILDNPGGGHPFNLTDFGFPTPAQANAQGADVGKAISIGTGTGITDPAALGKVDAGVKVLINHIVPPVRAALHISSPSKIFHGFGVFLTEGLANGITEGAAVASTTAATMAQDVIAAAQGVLDGGLVVPNVAVPNIPVSSRPNIQVDPHSPVAIAQGVGDKAIVAARSGQEVVRKQGQEVFDAAATAITAAVAPIAEAQKGVQEAFVQGALSISTAQAGIRDALAEGQRVAQLVHATVTPSGPPPSHDRPLDIPALAKSFGSELARRPEVTNVNITESADARATARSAIAELRADRMLRYGLR